MFYLLQTLSSTFTFKVAWFKNGEPIKDDRVHTTFLPDGTAKLSIENAQPGDSGAYKLVIKNSSGENACLCAVAVQRKYLRVTSKTQSL